MRRQGNTLPPRFVFPLNWFLIPWITGRDRHGRILGIDDTRPRPESGTSHTVGLSLTKIAGPSVNLRSTNPHLPASLVWSSTVVFCR